MKFALLFLSLISSYAFAAKLSSLPEKSTLTFGIRKVFNPSINSFESTGKPFILDDPPAESKNEWLAVKVIQGRTSDDRCLVAAKNTGSDDGAIQIRLPSDMKWKINSAIEGMFFGVTDVSLSSPKTKVTVDLYCMGALNTVEGLADLGITIKPGK